jgi:monofunctional glycosyltransferase
MSRGHDASAPPRAGEPLASEDRGRRANLNPRDLLRRILRGVAITAGAGFAYLCYAYLTLPDVRPLAATNPDTTAFIELRQQEAEAEGRPLKRVQSWVGYRRISPNLTRAVLVAEDAAFWDHQGIDLAEIQKSIELDWARGQLLRGASTITQQLAKNLYLSPSRNPIRKFRELIIARRLEVELDKARILELYLNVIEWGDGVYGVEAASRAYFGKSAAALDATEAALLAGAIINPRLLNPSHPTARLIRRQQLILRRMGAVTPPPPPPSIETAPPIETLPTEPVPPELPPVEPRPVEPDTTPLPPPEPPATPEPPVSEHDKTAKIREKVGCSA